MKRVFICGYFNFPRGSASANYVQYLGEAFRALGYEVVIVSNLNHKELERDQGKWKKHFKLEEVRFSSNKLLHYIQYNYLMEWYLKRIINQYPSNREDVFVCYSALKHFTRFVRTTAKKRDNISVACIVELYAKEDFATSRKNNVYEKYLEVIDREFPQFDLLFPISTYIAKYYENKGPEIQVLPIMADPDEYALKQVSDYHKSRFIYPANGKLKDSLGEMMRAIVCLSEQERDTAEFHICGVKEEELRKLLRSEEYDLIKNAIVVHSWLEYKNLVELYQKMDYLLLSRETKQSTLANFPSKVPEVMCYGVIPIVSRVGDYTRYYLEDGVNSIIFDGYKAADCCAAIRRALHISHEEKKALKEGALLCARQRFAYSNWFNTIKDALYRARKHEAE